MSILYGGTANNELNHLRYCSRKTSSDAEFLVIMCQTVLNSANVVAVVVGRLTYGSAADSLRWYGWLAGTGLARWRRRPEQTDRHRKSAGLAQH